MLHYPYVLPNSWYRFAIAIKRECVFQDCLSSVVKEQLLAPLSALSLTSESKHKKRRSQSSTSAQQTGEFSAVLFHPYFVDNDGKLCFEFLSYEIILWCGIFLTYLS